MSEIKSRFGDEGVKEIKKLSSIGVVIVDGNDDDPIIILVWVNL